MDLLNLVTKAHETHVNRYFVEIEFNDHILGAQPKSGDILEKFLAGKLEKELAGRDDIVEAYGSVEEAKEGIIESHKERMGDQLKEKTDQAWTGFFTDGSGPWFGTYAVKACLREMFTSLGITVKKRGSKQTYQHLMQVNACDQSGEVFSGEYKRRLHFYRKDGSPVTEPDTYIEMTAHVQTAQGPRSIIKRHDAINQARLCFVIEVAAKMPHQRGKAAFSDEDFALVLERAQGNGLGCSRSQGYGTFKVVAFRKLTDHPPALRAPGKAR